MIKAVVFDLDNTLMDFMKMKKRAVEEGILAMIDAGLPLTAAQADEYITAIYTELGMEYQQVFDEFLKRVLGKVDYKILSSGIVAYRRAREASLIPYPHVYSTLNKLSKAGIKLGILSDAPVLEAWLRLAYLNFHHIFDAVVTSGEVGKRKPDPEPFLAILGKLQVDPSAALMVGDWAERDIQGAGRLGMKTAFARYGDVFNTEVHNADYELTDFSQILEVVSTENSPS